MKKLESLNNFLFKDFTESKIQKQLLSNVKGGATTLTGPGCVNFNDKQIVEFSSDSIDDKGQTTYYKIVGKGDINGNA